MRLLALLGLVFFSALMTGCAGLAVPLQQDKAFVAISITTDGLFLNNDPDKVVIVNAKDNTEYSFTQHSGPYYYFVNLPTGEYQLKRAEFVKKGQQSTSQSSSGGFTASVSVTSNSQNDIPFTIDQLSQTKVKSTAGEFSYMGTIKADASVKLWPPGAIEFENVVIEKTSKETDKAFNYFKETFKEAKLNKPI